jgi:drug/metabolite transporter (DMT)-like permease
MATNTTRAYTPAGILAASGGVFTWGLGVIFIKLTYSPFLTVSFWRHAISIPILIAAWALHRDRSLPWRAASFGGVLFAAHQVANFSALRYSTAAIVTILFSLQPILVGAAAGRFVGERATLRFYLWSVVAIGGCIVLIAASVSHPDATTLGTVLAISNLVAWCAYYLATKRARENVSTIGWLLVMTLVSGALIAVLALVARQPFDPGTAREWSLLAAVAIIPGTLGHFLVTWAQPRIHVAASSALILGVPIVASAGAAIFLDEPFGRWHLLGAALALGGAAVAMRHLPPPVAREAAVHSGEVAS